MYFLHRIFDGRGAVQLAFIQKYVRIKEHSHSNERQKMN